MPNHPFTPDSLAARWNCSAATIRKAFAIGFALSAVVSMVIGLSLELGFGI